MERKMVVLMNKEIRTTAQKKYDVFEVTSDKSDVRVAM
jgi:hypothetical protein